MSSDFSESRTADLGWLTDRAIYNDVAWQGLSIFDLRSHQALELLGDVALQLAGAAPGGLDRANDGQTHGAGLGDAALLLVVHAGDAKLVDRDQQRVARADDVLAVLWPQVRWADMVCRQIQPLQ